MVRRLRAALAAGCVLAVLAAAACTTSQPDTTEPAHRPLPTVSTSPAPPAAAALAGGACLLLNYDIINKALGSDFDVAAAANKSGTYTCVVQGTQPYPDLTLSITATSLTPANFTADLKPAGATSVPDLGKVGYSAQITATSTAGPAIEIGWLSGNDRLIVMRYTAGAGATVADPVAAGMASLARTVDATTV